MPEPDWSEIKFLESSTNLQAAITQSIGRTPNTERASDIAACIQQGRLFFDAAISASIEIRPLQLYYGVVAFAKAVSLARTLVAIDTLTQSHGLSDLTTQNASIEDLVLRIDRRGSFQEFNDAVAPLGRIEFYENFEPTLIAKPFDQASKVAGVTLSIREILARTPHIDSLYQKTFGQSPQSKQLEIQHDRFRDFMEVHISDSSRFGDRDALRSIVSQLRQEMPFLTKWAFTTGSMAYGQTHLAFCNVDPQSIDEFHRDILIDDDGVFSSADQLSHLNLPRLPIAEIIPPLSGGIGGRSPHAMAPIQGAILSEYALHYMGCYLLSSLVRYRPHIWQRAISRTAIGNSRADDRSLALIEEFMGLVEVTFPELVVRAITAKQI